VTASGGAYRVLVGKLDGKKPLETHRLILEDNIKMSFINRMGAWIGFIWLRLEDNIKMSFINWMGRGLDLSSLDWRIKLK
jgi:hypothetical protein